MESKRGLYFAILVFIILVSLSIVSAGILDWFKGTGKASSQSQNVSVTVAGSNTVTIEVPTLSLNPIENNPVTFVFTANVSDADGVSDINDSSVTAKLTLGATTRQGSCSWSADISSTKANYSCSITLWYFDSSGSGWTLNVSASDFGTGILISNTSVFTYNELKAMVISPLTLTWATVTTGAVNQASSNDPTIINNTGNYNGPISVTAKDLIGETNALESIPASSFTSGSTSGTECISTALVNNVVTSIAGSNSNPGNLSAGGGQANLYYCIPSVPLVSSQVYSTTAGGSWAVQY
ncbi:MAG: hypothetical protein AABW63_01420 [Nanoarchaeota archaeon]